MPIWTQTIVVLLIVAACLAVVGFQLVHTLAGKKSRLGQCCAKGCPPQQAAKGNRVVFMPVEMLSKRR